MTLHIIKNKAPELALELILRSTALRNDAPHLVLIQEAVGLTIASRDFDRISVLKEDLEERGMSSPYPAIDYTELIELIARADRVITW